MDINSHSFNWELNFKKINSNYSIIKKIHYLRKKEIQKSRINVFDNEKENYFKDVNG